MRLHHDEGGNVIVLSVAASLLLIGMIWAIIGTGQRVVQKETIQSSADAAAFSAAVIKAKGLNIIAFCNLVMALLFAIVLLLQAIEYVLFGMAVVFGVICFVPFGEWACPIAAAAEAAADTVAAVRPEIEAVIKTAARALAITERAVAKITPVLSLIEAYHVGTDSAYQKNFGKGSLITMTYPLPSQGLPVKDGTCEDLRKQGLKDYDTIIDAMFEKLSKVLPTGFIRQGLAALGSPLSHVMCGGSATIDTKRMSSDCGECRQKGTNSLWEGNQIFRKGDVGCVNGHMPDGTACNPGQFDHDEHKNCVMSSMPSWSCPNEGASFVRCDSDSSGHSWRYMKFDRCEIDEPQQLSGTSDWPRPLVLASDWKQQRFVRGFTVLTDTNMETRRKAVDVASKDKGSAPMLNQMLGMAEAEFIPWNGAGHDDLFHMDWRARLVRFTFSDGSDEAGSEGDAAGSGVPVGSAGQVSGIVNDFLGQSGAAALRDQFLLH